MHGAKFEIVEAIRQITSANFTHKVLIAGNHDSYLQTLSREVRRELFKRQGIHYLEDELLLLKINDRTISLYGSPWTPTFGRFAYQKPEKDLTSIFARIPPNLDLLITHSPPYGILDANEEGENCGSTALANIVFERRPKHHIFGHIHEARGVLESEGITFRNVSSALNWKKHFCSSFSI